MKKLCIGALSALVLLSCALPAGALTYAPNAPDAAEPAAYLQAVADYPVREALRLGLAAEGMGENLDRPATRLELVETALTVAAACYGSDLENFLADCAQVRPASAASTAYRADAFSDTASAAAHWALALGLTSGTGNGTFSPDAAAGSAAASAVWGKTAALCGVQAGTEGQTAGTYTRRDCLTDALSLYDRAGGAAPLLTYEAETARLRTSFQSVAAEKTASAGTILYGTRDGAPALCIAYAQGGARTIPLPASELTYLEDVRYDGLLNAYGPDGSLYRIDLYTGESTPVAADTRTDSLEGSGGESRTKNEFGRYEQGDVALVNDSAAPHTLRHLTMETLTNNGGSWTLSKGDQVLLRVGAVESANYPFGQSVKVGYLHNGQLTDAVDTYVLGDTAVSFRIPESGTYQFFLENRSGSALCLTSLTVEVFHSENWDGSNLNDVDPEANGVETG